MHIHIICQTLFSPTEHDTNRRPDELHQVRLPLVNKKACIKSYQRYYSKIRNFHICSGATGKDTCQVSSFILYDQCSAGNKCTKNAKFVRLLVYHYTHLFFTHD